jgi:lysophospholipase L1-like esterase
MVKKICIFGDSIAHGSGDYEFGGWQNWLKVDFDKAGRSQHVFNLAISGRNSFDIDARVESEVRARMSESKGREDMMVIFAVPINDTRFVVKNEQEIFDVSTEQFTSNLEKINKKLNDLVATVVFVGMTSVDEEKTNPRIIDEDQHRWTNISIEKYNDIVKKYCAEKNIPFIEMIDVLADHDLPDGLHPNAGGTKKCSKELKIFLLKIISFHCRDARFCVST